MVSPAPENGKPAARPGRKATGESLSRETGLLSPDARRRAAERAIETDRQHGRTPSSDALPVALCPFLSGRMNRRHHPSQSTRANLEQSSDAKPRGPTGSPGYRNARL